MSFPVSRTLPDPIRQIDVIGEDTGQRVSNAEVVLHADRFTNWMRSFPTQYSAAYSPPSQSSVVVALKQEAAGRFTPERRRVWRYDRPWGIGPLGTTIHEDYTLTISVRATGYAPVTATYWPEGGLNPDIWMTRQATNFQFPSFTTNGTLTVFLSKMIAEPSVATNGNQPIPSETNGASSAVGSPL